MMEIHTGARIVFPVPEDMDGPDMTGVVIDHDGDQVTIRLDSGGGEYRTHPDVVEVLEAAPTTPRSTVTIAAAGTGTQLLPGQRFTLAEWPDVWTAADDYLAHPQVVALFGPSASGLVLLDPAVPPPPGAPAARLRLVGRNNGGASGHEYYRRLETAEDSEIIGEYPDEVDHFDRAYDLGEECADCGSAFTVKMIAWLGAGGHRRHLSCDCGVSWEVS